MAILQINPVTLRLQLEAEFPQLGGTITFGILNDKLDELTDALTSDAEIIPILVNIYENIHKLRILGTRGFTANILRIYDIIESHMIYLDDAEPLIRKSIFKNLPVNVQVNPYDGFVRLSAGELAVSPAALQALVVADQTSIEHDGTTVEKLVIEQHHIDAGSPYDVNEIGDIVTISILLVQP